ncbi:unnamed protein product [Caenorhabditis nigoni]
MKLLGDCNKYGYVNNPEWRKNEIYIVLPQGPGSEPDQIRLRRGKELALEETRDFLMSFAFRMDLDKEWLGAFWDACRPGNKHTDPTKSEAQLLADLHSVRAFFRETGRWIVPNSEWIIKEISSRRNFGIVQTEQTPARLADGSFRIIYSQTNTEMIRKLVGLAGGQLKRRIGHNSADDVGQDREVNLTKLDFGEERSWDWRRQGFLCEFSFSRASNHRKDIWSRNGGSFRIRNGEWNQWPGDACRPGNKHLIPRKVKPSYWVSAFFREKGRWIVANSKWRMEMENLRRGIFGSFKSNRLQGDWPMDRSASHTAQTNRKMTRKLLRVVGRQLKRRIEHNAADDVGQVGWRMVWKPQHTRKMKKRPFFMDGNQFHTKRLDMFDNNKNGLVYRLTTPRNKVSEMTITMTTSPAEVPDMCGKSHVATDQIT